VGELGLDLRLLLSQAVNFVLIAIILHRLLYKPLLANLEARARHVQESMQKAAEADRLLAEAEARYKAEIERAHREAHEIVEQGTRTAEQHRQEILAAVREESQQIIARAQAEAQREIRQGQIALRQEIVDLTIAAASQVIGKSLPEEEHHRLIEEFLTEASEL
jgi:F-type H+-transporting ATPase subunit b